MYVCGYMNMSAGAQGGQRGHQIPKFWVIGDCKPHHLDAGTKLVLLEEQQILLTLNLLSSPIFQVLWS